MTRILVPEIVRQERIEGKGGGVLVRWDPDIAPPQQGDQVLMSVELFERCIEILNREQG